MVKRNRSAKETADLFTVAARRGQQAEAKPASGNPEPERRYILPGNLSGALEWLSDEEIENLADAVASELKRRKLAPTQEPAVRNTPATAGPVKPGRKGGARRSNPQPSKSPPLTRARINAIRAAVKAGVKPTVIARKFGVSRSAIRQALSDGEN